MEGGNGHTKGVVSIEGLKDMFGVKVMPVIISYDGCDLDLDA
jgi:hypothetical protein